ncbi:MAG: hypothetical protein ACI8QZ_000989 [Chlamydiales bacterium]|jgi:hypothetical protein
MAELEAIRELLEQSRDGGTPFAEALVTANLVGDWELSRVVCEIFNLPFLPVDVAEPDPDACEGLNTAFLAEFALVPLWTYGQVLTVCMPALVPADVLGVLASETDLMLLPVVGTVEGNRRWVEENFEEAAATVRKEKESSWTSIFDDADAAVLMDMGPDGQPSEADTESELTDELTGDLEKALGEDLEKELAEVSNLEFTTIEPDETDQDDEPGSKPSDEKATAGPAEKANPGAGGLDLPPMPKFGS